jgi:sulfate transport system permease protein
MSGIKSPVIPGFGPTLGVTLFAAALVVLLPISALFMRAAGLSPDQFAAAAFSPRVMAAYRLSFGGALIAATFNVFAGLIVAWVLVRYDFPLRKLVDALVDLPFALPTAVAGVALTALYAPKGVLGELLLKVGIKAAFTPFGVVLAMIFIGLPFVVRTVQPVLQDLEAEHEEAAVSLGASRWQVFYYVVLPAILPALVTGFALAFARALGEYGSVIFIAGNMPGVSEIAPLMIITKLEQYDYAGASAIATVMLVAAFLMLLVINSAQKWNQARLAGR